MRKKHSKTRAGMMKSRKAFLFTLGLVLMSLAILSFAKFAFNEAENDKLLFQTEVIMQRLHDLDTSLQAAIADTFAADSGIEAGFDNSTIIFEEPLPNSMSVFEYNMDRLKTLAEANDTSVYIEANDTMEDLPIIVLPQNITYSHNFSTGQITITDGGNGSMTRIKTTITMDDNATCDWAYALGNFSYELNIINPKDSGCDHDRMVSLEEGVTITITNDAEASDKITITISNSTMLIDTDSTEDFSANVENKIYLQSAPEEAWLTDSILELDFPAFRLKRKGGARLI